MEPTKPQREIIAQLKREYGNRVVKPHAPDPHTGIMRVSLSSLAGEHSWFYSRDGDVVSCTLAPRLFDPPAPPHKPGNAIDN